MDIEKKINPKISSEFFLKKASFLSRGMSIKPLFSNHDVYKNKNAPNEVVNIQTHYESIYLKVDKKITYLSFNFND